MFCGNCGTEVKEGVKFCPSCGQVAIQDVPPQSVQLIQPPYGQPVVAQIKKKKKRRFPIPLRVLCIVLVIAIIATPLTINYFDPTFMSRFTHGKIGGLKVTTLTKDELSNWDFSPPSEADRKAYTSYATNLGSSYYKLLNSEGKAGVQTIREAANNIAALRLLRSQENLNEDYEEGEI